MGYTHLEPGQECEIVERVYSCDGNSDISALVQLSPAKLDELAQASMEKEKAIYAEALAIVARWKQQAYETVAYRKAQVYLRTLPVTHTSNQWVKGEYDWHEMSNMVYKFIWRSYENTRWDSTQKKSVPVSWELSWYLTYNTPKEPDFTGSGRQIAGQERKRFGEKATMEKYLQGRINAYAHLFKEISPPNGGQRCIQHRRTPGDKGGIDQAGQNDNRSLQTNAGVGLDKRLSDKTGSLAGKGGQRQRRQGCKHIQAEEATIDGHNQNERQNGDEQAAQHRYQPEGNALQKSDALYGVYHFPRDRNGSRGHTAHAAHNALNDTAANIENGKHQFHAVSDGGLCQDKTDKVAQGKFRPLKVPEAGCTLEDAHGKEQYQQAIAYGLQSIIDIDDGRPDASAPELLGRCGNQGPYLRQLIVPGMKSGLQIAYDPVVTQKSHLLKCVSNRDTFRQNPLLP